MYRRRRPRSGEILFSFDSFLDLVCNVVGVILRLILVAWVGAKTYTGVFEPPPVKDEPPASVETVPELVLSTEADKAAVSEAKQRLAAARAALLEQLRQQEALQALRQDGVKQTKLLVAHSTELDRKAADLDHQRNQVEAEQNQAELSLAEVRRRCAALEKELAALKKLPIQRHVLHYQTPLARTFQSEELHFEIFNGRVTFLDVDALVRDIKQGLQEKGEQLKTRWQLEDETTPVGAFKLRYNVVRERNLIDSVTSAALPDDRSEYRYGVERWEAVPVQAVRGEPLEKALTEESAFRRIIDHLDPTQTAVTFWVYPESFAAYRQLRDYCQRRDLLVAGRPLPDGTAIGSSRSGTASRGQ